MYRHLKVFSLSFLLTSFSWAQFEFPNNSYLGKGKFFNYGLEKDLVSTQESTSFCRFQGDKLLAHYTLGDKSYSYTYHFYFHNHSNIFDVEITSSMLDINQSEEEPATYLTHKGEGYCNTNQCNIFINLDDGRTVHETLTFSKNKLTKSGMLKISFQEGDYRIIWENAFNRVVRYSY